MGRLALLTCLPLTLLQAQFTNLATYGDGADLYYAVLAQHPAFFGSRIQASPIYKAGSAAAALFLSFPPRLIPPKPITFGESHWYITPYYLASHPQFSHDGKIFAFTTKRICFGGTGCIGVNEYQTTVHGVSADDLTFNGMGWLSANGRFLFVDPMDYIEGAAALIDLQSGQCLLVGQHLGVGRNDISSGRIVADDGTVVGAGSIFRVRDGSITELRFSDTLIRDAVIDAAAQTVVYAFPQTARMLRMYHPATGDDNPFLQANGDTYSPAITSDGKRVLFLSTAQIGTTNSPGVPQLYAINVDYRGFQALTSSIEPSGVKDYTMTDDGRVVWYVSGDGSLVKLDLRGTNAQRTVFRAPAVDLSATLVPGSAVTLNGSALVDSSSAAPQEDQLPTELAGVQVILAGVPAPILSVSPERILFQVPWQTPVEKTISLQVIAKAHTVEESSVSAMVTPVATSPALCTTPYCWDDVGGTAFHQDWSGPATSDKPSLPGEIIYLYGTGLGAVQPPVPTGVVAPADRLSTSEFACNASVLFAGLAPGLTGYYQITVQLPGQIRPNDPSGSLFDLECGGVLLAAIPVKPNLR